MLRGIFITDADAKSGKSGVSATFWAGDNRTTELFKQHLGELQQRLQAAGLRVGSLSARHGSPQTVDERPSLPYVLLDEEA